MKRSASQRRPSHAPEETLLIEKAATGDVQAFEQLYHAHAGRVYAVCLRLSGDPTRAEDIVQEVFIRLWERIGTYRARSAFSTWLHRLTVNLAVDRMRAELRRSVRETVGDGLESHPAPHPVLSTEAGMELEAAIASLPLGARTAFVLHDVEGYRHEEIARLTGLAAGTSKAQLHRARKLLRERLRW